jgi:thiosulfate dehydrogenase
MRHFVLGIVFTLVAFAAAGLLVIRSGLVPANADGPYLPGEKWAASTALDAVIARQMDKDAPPIQPTSENLIAGIKLYGQNCAVCHGASDARPTNIAAGLYQHTPQLAKHGVEDDPEGETYWKIEHGIRWTAMPSFGKAFSDTQKWQLSLFLKHMDQLPADAEAAWKAVPQPVALSAQSR